MAALVSRIRVIMIPPHIKIYHIYHLNFIGVYYKDGSAVTADWRLQPAISLEIQVQGALQIKKKSRVAPSFILKLLDFKLLELHIYLSLARALAITIPVFLFLRSYRH